MDFVQFLKPLTVDDVPISVGHHPIPEPGAQGTLMGTF